MTLASIIVSVISGLLLGFIYGHFFFIQRRNDLSFVTNTLQQRITRSAVFTLTRVSFLCITLYWLLRSESVLLILVVPTLIVTFLVTVYTATKKIK